MNLVVSGNGSISYSDYNEGSLNRSIYPSTDRPSPPIQGYPNSYSQLVNQNKAEVLGRR